MERDLLSLIKKKIEFYEDAQLNLEELYSLISFTQKAKCSLKMKQIKVLIKLKGLS